MLALEHLRAYPAVSVEFLGSVYVFKVKHLLSSRTSLCFISGYSCSLVLRDPPGLLNGFFQAHLFFFFVCLISN